FTVTISDGHTGGTVDQLVTVTIGRTSCRERVNIAGVDAAGKDSEDATTPNLSDTGTIAFNDVDLTYAHNTNVTAADTNTLDGTLTMGTVSESATTEPGTVGWTYQVSNAATQYRAAAQAVTD